MGFEVRDEGLGFDPATTADGTGVQGMRDRLGPRRESDRGLDSWSGNLGLRDPTRRAVSLGLARSSPWDYSIAGIFAWHRHQHVMWAENPITR